jgi:hypothetical protein
VCAGIKQVTGQSSTKSVPLKIKLGENITNRTKQMRLWIEHNLKLYSAQNVVTDAALSAINQLPVLDELNEELTKEELLMARDCLAISKAPCEEGIPTEVIKTGKDEIIEDLHHLFCLCWRELSTAGHAGRQNCDTLQEQRQQKRLQQLLGHFLAKYCRQSFC